MKVINGTYYHTGDIQTIVDSVLYHLGGKITEPESLADEIVVGYSDWLKIWWPESVPECPLKFQLPHRGNFHHNDLEVLAKSLDSHPCVPSNVVRLATERMIQQLSFMLQRNRRYSLRYIGNENRYLPGTADTELVLAHIGETQGCEARIRIRASCPRDERLQAQLRNQTAEIKYRETRANHHGAQKDRYRRWSEYHERKETTDQDKLAKGREKLQAVMRAIASLPGEEV